MLSIFMDEQKPPEQSELVTALAGSFNIWQNIEEFVKSNLSGYINEWKYSGAKHGWSYRIKDKRRVIIYLLPRDKFFKVAMVFGEKAYYKIMESDITSDIKNELSQAKVYPEGRGIRIEVKNIDILDDIKKLILIKLIA